MNEVLFYIHNQGVPAPVPILMKKSDGKEVSLTYEQLDPQSPDKFAVRLLTFIDGKLLVQVPFTPEVLEKVGTALANLDKALCVSL